MLFKLFLLPLLAFIFTPEEVDLIPALKPMEKVKVNISEPSDLCFSSDGQHLFIVSDRGKLYKTDLNGKVIDKAKHEGADFEGVCVVGDQVYVVDETLRMILEYDAEKLKLQQSRQYRYSGAANRGWESLFFNPESSRFLAFTEKMPVLLHEFDENLDQVRVNPIEEMDEISGAVYHEGRIWVVSDEDRVISIMTTKKHKVKKSWRIPVLNPEGIAISPQGELWIISDDMATIYKFKMPEA